ncbi:hypothetical protein CRYUN_Cryun23aG0011300 [Craigia yunnanensis]
MKKMKALSLKAHKWFKEKDPTQWSKSHFSTMVKCDMLLNNLSEPFNKYILEARDKPILTLMEIIRTKLMQRIAMKSVRANKYLGPLCPKIQQKLDNIIVDLSRCWPKLAGGIKYQVAGGPAIQYMVDFQMQTCSCRKWDLTSIPRMHAGSFSNVLD